MSRKSLKKPKVGLNKFKTKNPYNILYVDDENLYGKSWVPVEDGIDNFKPEDMLIIDRVSDVVDDISISKPVHVSLSKTQKKRRNKKERKALIEKAKKKWLHIPPTIIDDPIHVAPFKKAVADFFRPGYEKYIEKDDIKDDEIYQYVSSLLKKYKAVITGGFVLKNMGLFTEGNAKPSVDMDIFHSFYAPLKGDFYNDMAKLFNCDIESKVDEKIKWNHKYMPGVYKGGRLSILGKQNMDSVRKYIRNSNGDGLYAEMDLCRAMNGTSHINLIRNFDMTICMNWYDGEHIYTLDRNAIIDPENHTGWVHHKYSHCFDGFVTEEQKKWCKRSYTRVLKYLLRGYRLSYVDPKTALIHELVTSQFPTEIRELNRNIREKYYKKNPDERPDNIPVPLLSFEKIFPLDVEDAPVNKGKNIYIIGGHGGDYKPVPPTMVKEDIPKGYFRVPKDCAVIAKANKGQLTFAGNKYEPLSMIIDGNTSLSREMLADPDKYAADLMQLFGIIKIYKENDLCPDFTYTLLSCFNQPDLCEVVDNGYSMYGLSGTISYDLLNDSPIQKGNKKPIKDGKKVTPYMSVIFYSNNDAIQFYRAKHHVISNIRHMNGYKDDMKNGLERIITTLCGLYSYSILPDKYMILQHIEKYGKSYITLLSKNNMPEYADIIALFKTIGVIHFTQKELCVRRPGVYYNFVCRYIHGLTDNMYSVNYNGKTAPLHALNSDKIAKLSKEKKEEYKLLVGDIIKESLQQSRFKNGKYSMPNNHGRIAEINKTHTQKILNRMKYRTDMGISDKIDQIDKQIKMADNLGDLKTSKKLHDYKNAIMLQMTPNNYEKYKANPDFKKHLSINNTYLNNFIAKRTKNATNKANKKHKQYANVTNKKYQMQIYSNMINAQSPKK